jgi:hypothetical protein
MRSPQQVIILKGIRKVTLCELPCNLSAFAAEHKVIACDKREAFAQGIDSDEAIQLSSFRGDAKHRARNLEIPRCTIAHPRSGPAPSRNDMKMDCFASLAMTA